jgi:hypothetical protein
MKAAELFAELATTCERWDLDLPAGVGLLAKMGVDRLKAAKTKDEFVAQLGVSLKAFVLSSAKT